MADPHIRIFPHSQEEFASIDTLTTWLLTGLRARGGRYRLRSRDALAELPIGSIVLFRYGNKIVGEAIVAGYFRESSIDRTLAGEEFEYKAYIMFSQTSIRVYAPPVPTKKLQAILGDSLDITKSAIPYYKIEDWTIYPRLLAEIVESGAFI